MARTLALEHLYDGVAERLAVVDPSIDVRFGWREPTKQDDDAKRLIFVPGDNAWNVGTLKGAKYPGRVPRPVGTLVELFHVYVVAFDATDLDNERLQYAAARHLYDCLFAAVKRVSGVTAQVVGQRWETGKKEFRRGAAIVVTFTIESMIAEDSSATGTNAAPVGADVTDRLGDTTEAFEVGVSEFTDEFTDEFT